MKIFLNKIDLNSSYLKFKNNGDFVSYLGTTVIWKHRGYFRGISGFENAIPVLRSRYLENDKLPYGSSKGLSGLYNAIRKGYYTEFGVSNWNEMKEYCFFR